MSLSDIKRKVFLNKNNNQMSITLPKKIYKGKNAPKEILITIKRWFE